MSGTEHRLIGSACTCGDWSAQCGNDIPEQWRQHVNMASGTEHSAEGLCTCPTPNRPTGREPEQLAPWECLTCGGYACEYAYTGQKKCPPWRCDCFIDEFPNSPRDPHPEVFIVSVTPPAGGGSDG